MIILYMLAGILSYLIIAGIVKTYAEYRVYAVVQAFKHYEKEVNKAFNTINSSFKQAELLGSVKERFKQFQKLTEEQQALVGQVDRPSASAAHSKFKNSVIKEIKDIEEKKREILKNILDDGIDVHITMIDGDGKSSKMKISEILANHPFEGSAPDQKTDPRSPGDNVRKLQLVKEKDDEPDNPEIH